MGRERSSQTSKLEEYSNIKPILKENSDLLLYIEKKQESLRKGKNHSRKSKHIEGLKSKVLVIQSCLTVCDPMDCSPPGSSVHRIPQTRILVPFSSRSLRPKDWTWVSCIASRFFFNCLRHQGSPMHNRDHWEERREKGAKKKLWLIFFFFNFNKLWNHHWKPKGGNICRYRKLRESQTRWTQTDALQSISWLKWQNLREF